MQQRLKFALQSARRFMLITQLFELSTGNLVRKLPEGETDLLWVNQRFELSVSVRVIKG